MVPFLLLCLLIFHSGVVTAQVLGDTLQQGGLMNATNSLMSSQKKFSMRFFDGYLGRYLGLYYNNIQFGSNPLWVGNRNTPVNLTSVLSVESESGYLIVSSDLGTTDSPPIMVLYNSSMGFNRTATLLDTGNLVLREGGVTLWQSFDYPTDTLLPGMKLGFNHKTSSAWLLTSWMNENDPSLGAFTLEWDSRERGLVVKFRGKVHWTSGKLRNNIFEKMVSNIDYKYINHSDVEREDYFSYTVDLEDAHLSMPDSPGWKLTYNGNIYEHANEEILIAAVDNCYGYNTNRSKNTSVNNIAGCELFEQPKCRNAMQKFEAQTGFFTSSSDIKFFTNDHITGYSDCKAKCWEDCDCIGFMTNEETECIFSRGSTNPKFHNDGNSNKIYILTTDSTSHSHKKWNKDILVVVLILGFYIVVVFSSGILCDRGKNILEAKDNQIQELLEMDRNSELGRHNINDIRFYSFKSIAVATKNFSTDNKLGEGGFGPVYKGEFPKGKVVAVKKLSRKSKQGISELKNELTLVANLQHTNLVRMLGCCIDREEKMLIYDYMPNKSLDLFLFDESKKVQLTWERRFSIIEGISQGLLYLHKYSRLKIIHRDLKAANILLDQNMNPKISDFGLARIFMQNLPEANTSRVVGTYGYMAPEYAMEGIFSVKSDVYSFGVLILEILSGRKNKSFYDVEVPYNLVALAWELWNSDAAFELMDPSLADSCIQHQFMRFTFP
ncbi:Receptor-like serine/threonine-protein kinase [Heracleum sosnowskyi]|uniref:Receptor-like serine/threonine-protein kinase n=1 Tax=Heracleum sosnowskyi TaxID=360622 RepID=A0AAD8HYY6_9APIA|nr:Receptor-like serine/threonine-protein kinase [Heracleum sosnowskyi]